MIMQTTHINKMYGPHPGDAVLYQLAKEWDVRFRIEIKNVLYPEYWWEYKRVRAAANVSEFLCCAAEGRRFIPVDMDGPYDNETLYVKCPLDVDQCETCGNRSCREFMLS